MGHFNDQLGMRRSYYAATAHAAPNTAALEGEARADVVVVGAGCTGLAAARTAASQGRRVIVLEGGEIGWGASGRNGGQMIPGLRIGAAGLIKAYGFDQAKRLLDLADSARDEVVSLIQSEAIDCDLKLTGHLNTAVREGDLADMREEYACLTERMDYPHVQLLDADAVRAEVAHPYVGGLLHTNGGHLHPLNYTLGLAHAAAKAGARIYTRSPARSVERSGSGVEVRTAHGVVRADACVLAGDALLGSVDRKLEAHIMPVANYIAVTKPLPNPNEIIMRDRAVSDSRFVVNYFRLAADGRLIFGGGERYTTDPPSDMAAFVRPFLQRTFPQLAGVEIDYAWGGMVSITRSRLPHIGRDGPIYWAHGYSGMGVILSTLAGRILADAIDGRAANVDLFASVAPHAFPGGAAFRGPLHLLAMLWFSLRDRIGV
ncbi:MAG: FAD-binding oxidoreductase [Hyphomonadaceae bacterium]|nr:FAD-binding oxidoreductase [Hyphomonadaceae bacterium]